MNERAAPTIARRRPFSTNPIVGPRGQRTQQRILDAALRLFSDQGYHGCSVERIAKLAGCSRVAFYQYFSGKEEVFEHLAAQVARHFAAASEALMPVTADRAGWEALHAWVARYAQIYERSSAVFRVFDAAAQSTPAVETLRAVAADRNVARLRAKVSGSVLPPRKLDAVIALLLDAAGRTFYSTETLRSAAPEAYSRERIQVALTDVMHRVIFERRPGLNDHPAGPALPALRFSPAVQAGLREPPPTPERSAAARATVDALLTAGREVLTSRGYHATRVDDIVKAAGVSHGSFYRYFANLAEFTRVLVIAAIRPLSETLAAIPAVSPDDPDSRGELRAWLQHYNATHVDERAMIRVWVDASAHDADVRADSAPAVDWGRRRMAAFLAPRGFGDVDAEAVVTLAILEAFGAAKRSRGGVETVADVIERGLLGLPT